MRSMKVTYHYLLPIFLIFSLFTTLALFNRANASSKIMAGDLKVVYKKDKFPFDSLFKIDASDFFSAGSDQIVLLGRDYIENKAIINVFSWSGKGLEKVWESENLLEEKSPIFMATGRPYVSGEEAIIILTNHHLYIFTYQEGGFVLASQIYHTLLPQEINVVDINGDGIDELLVVRIGKVTKTYLEKVVDLYRLEDEKLIKMGSSPLLGNIRAITGSDLNGDGREEILVESGIGDKTGTFSLLRWTEEGELKKEFSVERLVSAVAYGLDADLLKMANGEDRNVLVTADDWGRVNIFTYSDGRFRPQVKEVSLKSVLVSAVIGDFNGDGLSDLAVGGFPTKLFLLTDLSEW